MSISEAQRQSYLETMGIHSYFPRFILPGAKESFACAWPEEIEPLSVVASDASEIDFEQETSSAPVLTEEKPVVASSVKAAESPARKILFDSETEVKPKPATESKETVQTAPLVNSDSAEEVRFQLAFIRVNEQVCILNQIPYIGLSQLSNTHQTLLINLLKALKLETTNVLFEPMSFSWPMGEGAHFDKTEAAAGLALNSYLEQKHSDGTFKLLLVMGEMSAKFIDSDQADWQVVCTRSLDEMLAMPQIKRDVWSQLRTLSFTDPASSQS